MKTLTSFPRLHIGLLDMANATDRAFGGAGFFIAGPPIRLRFELQPHFELLERGFVDSDGKNDLQSAVARLRAEVGNSGIRLEIEDMPPQHVGLGTKTALILGALKSIQLARRYELSESTLQEISGRGGASGVGVNGFFTGGFVVDLGHSAAEYKKGLVPSSAKIPAKTPPATIRLRIPANWVFHLLLPPGKRFAGQSEIAFFRTATPIPGPEALEAIAATYHGVVPSVLYGDLSALKRNLRTLRQTGFKRREIDGQPKCVTELVEEIDRKTPCAVTMSSMGPLVFAVAQQNDSRTETALRDISSQTGTEFLGSFGARNSGYEVSD